MSSRGSPSKPKRKRVPVPKPVVIRKKRIPRTPAVPEPQRRGNHRSGRGRGRRPRKAREEILERLTSEYVYMERESPFVMPQFIKLSPSVAVARIDYVQRILGMTQGILHAFDGERRAGEVEIGGHRYPLRDAQNRNGRLKVVDLLEYVGKEISFSFWPSVETPAPRVPEGTEQEGLQEIKFSSIRRKTPFDGYVEAIGKLRCCWRGGFEVALFSKLHQKSYRIVFSGDYPYPDEVGEFVWVTGRFDPATGMIHYEEAAALAFLDRKDAPKLLETIEKKRAARRRRAERKRAVSGGEGAPSPPASFPS